MLKKVALFCLTTVAILAFAGSALACSCSRTAPWDTIRHTPTIFTGTAMSSTNAGGEQTTIFQVSKTWKGGLPDNVALTTRPGEAACGWEFQAGQTYTVYAYPTDGDALTTGYCSMMHFMSQPERSLTWLEIYQAQLTALSEAAESGPSVHYQTLALFLLEHGQPSAAVRALDRLLEIEAGTTNALTVGAHIYRAMANYRLGRFDEAIVDLNRVPDGYHPSSDEAAKALKVIETVRAQPAPTAGQLQDAWPQAFPDRRRLLEGMDERTPVCVLQNATDWLKAVEGDHVALIEDKQSFLDRSLAAFSGAQCSESIFALLNRGADPNAKDFMGEPLLYALNKQHRPEMMLLLLSFGASPNVDSTRGISLGYSLYVRDGRAAEEQRALLEIMLRHGLDPNRDARLVLHLLDDEKIVDLRMMLEHGLRPDLIYNGKTLLDIAASHGQTEVVKTLKAALE
jgi:hypothetical protein